MSVVPPRSQAVRLAAVLLFLCKLLSAQSLFVDTLREVERLPEVPTPDDVLAFRLGSRPLQHHEILECARAIDKASSRIEVLEIGRSALGRSLIVARYSETAEIQSLHDQGTARILAGEVFDLKTLPVRLWFGMAVHGDEASGVEAGLLLLYDLASDARSAADRGLSHVLIDIDLAQNPDGRERFAVGVRDRAPTGGDVAKFTYEQTEPWPSGRVNANGFDLNRDWVLQTQPETVHRAAHLLRTRPHVAADFHEMGSDQSYYLSAPPGSPVNQHISKSVHAAWQILLDEFARTFDQRGWPYWTGDHFPADFPGYGGTWPCFHGCAGLTLEQASSGASAVKRKDGTTLTLVDAATRHFEAGRALIAASSKNRLALLEAYSAHFRQVKVDGERDERPVFVLLPRPDPDRNRFLQGVLERNGILCEVLAEEVTIEAWPLARGERQSVAIPAGSVIVNSRQAARPMVLALLDPDVHFDASLVANEERRQKRRESSELYDVTAWNLPLLFGVEAWRAPPLPSGTRFQGRTAAPVPSPLVTKPVVGWLASGRRLRSRAALARYSQADVPVRVLPFRFTCDERTYEPGTGVLVASSIAKGTPLSEIVEEDVRSSLLTPITTFRTSEGHDLGSPRAVLLQRPEIVVATGEGTAPTSSLAVRWLLDAEFDIQHQVVPLGPGLLRALQDSNVLVLPDGEDPLRGLTRDALLAFTNRGGAVIALGRAGDALAREPFLLLPLESPDPKDHFGGGKGAIVALLADTEHPLLRSQPATLHTLCRAPFPWKLRPDENVRVLASYSPLANPTSGFLTEAQAKSLDGTPFLLERSVGSGRILAFREDVVARGAMPGLWPVFLDALLLGASGQNR